MTVAAEMRPDTGGMTSMLKQSSRGDDRNKL